MGSSARISFGFAMIAPCDSDELLLAAGELARVEIFLADDLKAIERIGDHRLAFAAFDIAVGKRNIKVLVNREVIEQMVLLEDKADVPLIELNTVLRF